MRENPYRRVLFLSTLFTLIFLTLLSNNTPITAQNKPKRKPTLEEKKLLHTLDAEMAQLRTHVNWRPGGGIPPVYSGLDQLKEVVSKLTKMGGEVAIYHVLNTLWEISVLLENLLKYSEKLKSNKRLSANFYVNIHISEAGTNILFIKIEIRSSFKQSVSLDQTGTYGKKNAPYVIPWLAKKNSFAREYIAIVLGILKSKKAVPALIQALNDQEQSVRQEAAKSLGVISDRRAVQPLTSRLEDDNTKVRFAAAVALYKISGDDAESAIQTVKQQMREVLKDKNKQMRIKAIVSLAELRATDAIDDLRQLATKDPEQRVRNVAKEKVEELEKIIKASVQKE